MKKIFNIVLFLLMSASLPAQVVGVGQLTKEQAETIFSDKAKADFKMNLPIKTAFQYEDKSGQFYVLFCEKESDKNNTITAYFLKKEKNGLKKIRELNDFTVVNKNTDLKETTINFWESYSEFNDIDSDGFVEPVIVYRTTGLNELSDGRINFLIYYKQQKIAIHHQNGTLDFERNTRVDKAFYTLKPVLQNYIKSKMKQMQMAKDSDVIFPYRWEKAMQQKKLYFDEN